ncbi:MAG: TonB-dependent receptor [Candidatus Azobacteroides sp.]|nr:TonB-dependent receptor [Candidatus Azobacteroides sp.]
MQKVFLLLAASILSLCVFAETIDKDSLNTFKLQEVEVISVRANTKTPVAYSDMNKREIESFNFGQDIPFLLTLTPSVIATSDAGTGIGYTGFRIRGTDANRINVTANGIPLNDSESHGVFWVNMPDFASSLQNLQVQRGVGTSTNGAGAFGASINMKTEDIPTSSYGEWDGSYGSFNTAKMTFKLGTGILNKHWAFDGRLSSITSDGFIDRATADLKSYFVQGAYFNENTLLKFITFGGKEKTYHAWDGVPDYILSDILLAGNRRYNPCGYMGDDANGNPLYYKNQTDNYRQTNYQLSLLQIINPRLNLNVSLHYTQGAGYYEEYKLNRSLKEYGLTIENEEGIVKKSDLVRRKYLDNDFGGLIFSLNYTQSKWNVSFGGGGNYYDGNHFGKVIWVKEELGNANQEYYRSKGKKTDINFYLKGNYQLTKNLNLYGDLQYRFIDYQIQGQNDTWDWINETMQKLDIHEKFPFFNPKVGLSYRINPENTAYGSFAIAHREPNRNNYTDAGFNETPQPERLRDYELGYKYNRRIVSAGVNLYYMQYKDQLVLNGKTNEIGEPLTSNVPDSYRAGIEFLLGFQISKCLKWNGNLTLSRNKIRNYQEYLSVYQGENWDLEETQVVEQYKQTDISFSPHAIANSLLSFQKDAFSAALQSVYVGKQYLDNTRNSDRQINDYLVHNLRLGYTFRWKGVRECSLQLLINNFFNKEYESNGWVAGYYYRNEDGSLTLHADKSYFPQAGTNVLASINLKF